MPTQAVRQTVESVLNQEYSQLVRCDDVMLFRPFGQAAFESDELTDGEGDSERFADAPLPGGSPIVALLDGLPVENHDAVRERLIVDDEDGLGEQYSPKQQHGTAMASLILHGDLNEEGECLATPVYCRPILVPTLGFSSRVREVTPDDELLVDLVHRAVRRLFEGDSPAAPTVKVVNLSIANRFQPFDRETSPLGRLLDWLSWKYKVLFLVSVGNHTDDVALDISCSDLAELGNDELLSHALHAVRRDRRLRRPFAPSESVNAISVGAVNTDACSTYARGRRRDLLASRRLPSLLGTCSPGFRRAIKPEILLPGGRQLYSEPVGANNDPAVFTLSEGTLPTGLRVATPGLQALELNRTAHSRGTSNATALATRHAARIFERLLELQEEPGGDQLEEQFVSVLLKCLLVHGATWGENGELLDSVFRDSAVNEFGAQSAWRELDRMKNALLGYGEIEESRAFYSNDERVTVIGWANIREDQGHVFQFPLPAALTGSNVVRRFTGTLAWFSPVNPQHRNYRQAYLWFNVPEEEVGVSRREVDSDSSRRGTVEHRVLEGNRVVAIGERDSLEITVSCKSDAGKLREAVPYALAITLEVAEPLEVSTYEQIRNRVRQRIDL